MQTLHALSTLGLSTLAVAVAEIGDKTQLLALLLAARFRKPWPIVAGILVATLLNHALAAWLGALVAQWLSPEVLRWIVAGSFLAIALWTLKPDKLDESDQHLPARGAFIATTIAFFLAEIGDKTQVATVLLAAKYSPLWQVIAGTTLGMLLANVPVVALGIASRTGCRCAAARIAAAILFLLLALWVALRGRRSEAGRLRLIEREAPTPARYASARSHAGDRMGASTQWLRDLATTLLARPDEIMLELGAGGELLVARIRALLSALVLLLPLLNAAAGGNSERSADRPRRGDLHQHHGAGLAGAGARAPPPQLAAVCDRHLRHHHHHGRAGPAVARRPRVRHQQHGGVELLPDRDRDDGAAQRRPPDALRRRPGDRAVRIAGVGGAGRARPRRNNWFRPTTARPRSPRRASA